MDRIVPALFVALAGSLILVFTYLNLYLQERQKYLALWLTSLGALCRQVSLRDARCPVGEPENTRGA